MSWIGFLVLDENYTLVGICVLNIFWFLDAVCVLDGFYNLDEAYLVDEDCALDEGYILDENCIVGGAGVFFVLGGYRVVGRVLYFLIGWVKGVFCLLFGFLCIRF